MATLRQVRLFHLASASITSHLTQTMLFSNMSFSVFLLCFQIILVVMGTGVWGGPVCPSGCRHSSYHEPIFKHVSDLQESSVAPWNLSTNTVEGRYPESIQYANCGACKLDNKVAKPIYLEIPVYQRVHMTEAGQSEAWCRCPYKLAVGCTCV